MIRRVRFLGVASRFLRCPFNVVVVKIPSLPFDVCHLEQSDVIFEANAVEVIERRICLHGFSKVLGCHIELLEYCFQVSPLLCKSYNNLELRTSMISNTFVYDLTDRNFPRATRNVRRAVKETRETALSLYLSCFGWQGERPGARSSVSPTSRCQIVVPIGGLGPLF
jgi:hypothetical protein